MSAWQPIETAPKNGISVLVYFGPGVGIYQVFWSEEPYGAGIGSWCVTDNKNEDKPLRGYGTGAATHWMPLPAPPTVDEGKVDPARFTPVEQGKATGSANET